MPLAGPKQGIDPNVILDMDDETRTRTLAQMGAANMLPPLPHSPCLKNKKTGIVLPWNELLAAQRDLVDCCDESGNTDPAAWEPRVVKNEVDPRVLQMQAQAQILATRPLMAPVQNFAHYSPPVVQQNYDGTEYDRLGVTAYNDINKLRQQLAST